MLPSDQRQHGVGEGEQEELPPPPSPPPPPLEPVLAVPSPRVSQVRSDGAKLEWGESSMAIPPTDDPRQLEVQQRLTYAVGHELQMAEVPVPGPGAFPDAQLEQARATIIESNWMTVLRDPHASAAVGAWAARPGRGRATRDARAAIDAPPPCWGRGLCSQTHTLCLLLEHSHNMHLRPLDHRPLLLAPPRRLPRHLLTQVTALRPGRYYAVRARCTAVATPLDAAEGELLVAFPPACSQLLTFRTVPTPPGPMQPPALSQRARNALKVRLRGRRAALRGGGRLHVLCSRIGGLGRGRRVCSRLGGSAQGDARARAEATSRHGRPPPPVLGLTSTAAAELNLSAPPCDAQLKWALPDETGGEPILDYVLQMQPSPLGWEGAPNSEVGRGASKAAWCGGGGRVVVLLADGAVEGLLQRGTACFGQRSSGPNATSRWPARSVVCLGACALHVPSRGARSGRPQCRGGRAAHAARRRPPLQGFFEVYSGDERSFKVARLAPGVRYTFRIMVRGAGGASSEGIGAAGSWSWGLAAAGCVLLRSKAHQQLDSSRLGPQGGALGPPARQRVFPTPFPSPRATPQGFNHLGPSPWSLCSAFSTQASVPAAPEPPAQAGCSADSVTLQWAAPADNGAPVSGYTLEVDDGRGGEFRLAYSGLGTAATVAGLQVRRRRPGRGGRAGPSCVCSSCWADADGGGSSSAQLRPAGGCTPADLLLEARLHCAENAALVPSPLLSAQSGLPYRFRLQAENSVSARG